MLRNIGGTELLLILLVGLVLFGSKKIPELAKGLGQGIREFKKAMRDLDEPPEGETREESSIEAKGDQSKSP